MQISIGSYRAGGQDGKRGGQRKTDRLGEAYYRQEQVAMVRNHGEQVGHVKRILLSIPIAVRPPRAKLPALVAALPAVPRTSSPSARHRTGAGTAALPSPR